MMSKLQKLIVLPLMALLIGCAGQSRDAVEAEAASKAVDTLPEVSSQWIAAQAAGAVTLNWLDTFSSPTLNALVEEAIGNNYNLAVAAANVEQAQALARQAGAALVPSVDLSSGGSRSRSLGDNAAAASNSYNLGLGVSWEADLWGRIGAGVAQASLSAQAAQADYTFAQHSLAANTALGYFTAIEAATQTTIATEALNIIERIGRIVEAQYTEGVASAGDVALARSDLASARERVATLEGSARDSLRALEQLLGRYPGADATLESTLPMLPSPPPAGLPSDLLKRRPDLIAAERRVAAAFNAVDQAEAARLPSLSLTGSLGGSSTELTDLVDPANLAWSLGANLLAPIFDGGRRKENVNIANAQQKAALAQYGDQAVRAFGEVESLLDQGSVLRERETQLQEAADQAQKARRLSEVRYKEGEGTLVDLLSLQQRVLNAQSTLSSVRRLRLAQRVSLNLALGGGW